MPWSEVCMHMQIAGKKMKFTLISNRMVQLLDEDERVFSAPILTGEAGVYEEAGKFYYYPDGI